MMVLRAASPLFLSIAFSFSFQGCLRYTSPGPITNGVNGNLSNPAAGENSDADISHDGDQDVHSAVSNDRNGAGDATINGVGSLDVHSEDGVGVNSDGNVNQPPGGDDGGTAASNPDSGATDSANQWPQGGFDIAMGMFSNGVVGLRAESVVTFKGATPLSITVSACDDGATCAVQGNAFSVISGKKGSANYVQIRALFADPSKVTGANFITSYTMTGACCGEVGYPPHVYYTPIDANGVAGTRVWTQCDPMYFYGDQTDFRVDCTW